MISRETLVADLAELAGPLGPFVTAEERERARIEWQANLPQDFLPVLIDILEHPPSLEEHRPVSWDEFEMELSEALAAIGRRNAQPLLQKLDFFVGDPHVRPTAITVVGLMGSPAGLYILEKILELPKLTSDELERLACALGEIGGSRALSVLERMQLLAGATQKEVANEIEIALAMLRRQE